jgi:predicted MarR family transcription regulator
LDLYPLVNVADEDSAIRYTLDKLQDGKLIFTKTKSGKNRSIPVLPELYAEISKNLKNMVVFRIPLMLLVGH